MEFSEITKKYWEEKDWQDLEKSENAQDWLLIAKRIIERMPKPLIQVCGPIANGGLGSVEKNLNFFNETIKSLQKEGLNIFDQMPFEEPMQKYKKKFPEKDFFNEIMNGFYLPLFESRVFSTFYFLPNWESSIGSKWEYEQAKRLSIEIKYL